VAADAGRSAAGGIGLLVFAAELVHAFAHMKWHFDRLDAVRR
jgi:hypothetical protein